MFEKQLVKWISYIRSLKAKIQFKMPLSVVLAVVWFGLSIFVFRLARLNETTRRTLTYNAHKKQCSKEKDDSIWKEQVLDELTDVRQFRMCSVKLDSLNQKMAQTIVELRKVNKRLKTTKFK